LPSTLRTHGANLRMDVVVMMMMMMMTTMMMMMMTRKAVVALAGSFSTLQN